MKRHSIIFAPIGAFFSKPLYRAACRQWKGTGFGYLFLLLALCAIPFLVRTQAGVVRFVEVEAPRMMARIPVVTIENGRLSLEQPQPYTIPDPDTGEPLVVIDTTGEITSLEQTPARALITETHALIRKSAVETRIFSFQGVESFTLDQDRVLGWLEGIRKYLAPALYPFAVLFAFIGRAIQALVYATIGLGFAALFRSRRTYAELLRLSVVAMTPGILIRTLQAATHAQIPFAGLWFFLCTLAYLAYGVQAASWDDAPAETRGPPAIPAA